MLQAHSWLLRDKHHQRAGLPDAPFPVENEIFPVVWAQRQLHTSWNLPKDENSRADAALSFPVATVRRIKSKKGMGKNWLEE